MVEDSEIPAGGRCELGAEPAVEDSVATPGAAGNVVSVPADIAGALVASADVIAGEVAEVVVVVVAIGEGTAGTEAEARAEGEAPGGCISVDWGRRHIHSVAGEV